MIVDFFIKGKVFIQQVILKSSEADFTISSIFRNKPFKGLNKEEMANANFRWKKPWHKFYFNFNEYFKTGYYFDTELYRGNVYRYNNRCVSNT